MWTDLEWRENMGRLPADSAAQLRREANKARKLAQAAFGEDERRRLFDVAATLDREAMHIESVLDRASHAPSRRRPSANDKTIL